MEIKNVTSFQRSFFSLSRFITVNKSQKEKEKGEGEGEGGVELMDSCSLF